MIAREWDRPNVAHRRAQWIAHQNRVAADRLVFIDEIWTRTNMAPFPGRAPAASGSRPRCRVANGRPRSSRRRGAVIASVPLGLIDGPINGERFRIYVEKALAPTLKPGDIVIMDNLGPHRGKAVRNLIRATGAKLFVLPIYSPDLNRSRCSSQN